jgi:acetyl esterase/lipase
MTGKALLAAHTTLAPVRGGGRGRMLNLVLRGYFKRRLQRMAFSDAAIAEVRQRMEAIAARSAMRYDDLVIRDTRIAGVPVEIIEPQGVRGDAPVLLYFHGGAFLAGSPRTHRSITTWLARQLGARVLLPDYRLAPEHPFPAALDDVSAVYRAVLENTGAHRIAFAGDSAGGNLVLTALLRARDSGLPPPAAAVALSPWSDLTGSGDSVRENARADAMLPAGKIDLAARIYAGERDLRDPHLSPAFADMHGFPPLLLHVGTTEILLDDATRVLVAAREAGVEAHLRLWQDLPHVFHIFALHLPAARAALTEAAQFLHGALASAGHTERIASGLRRDSA